MKVQTNNDRGPQFKDLKPGDVYIRETDGEVYMKLLWGSEYGYVHLLSGEAGVVVEDDKHDVIPIHGAFVQDPE